MFFAFGFTILHTLYAVWSTKSYDVVFNKNAADAAGTMTNQTIAYDETTVLKPNAFTRTGYSFGGWALTENGAEAYADKATVLNLATEGTVNLYAVWIQNAYLVSFDYQGGTGSVSSKNVSYGSPYGALPEYPQKTGYSFEGWYNKAGDDGAKRITSDTIVTRNENHTLYAHWRPAIENDVIQDLKIQNVPDNNGDGVPDAYSFKFKCSSYFEKLNLPMYNLVVGQRYKLSFTQSNNATQGTDKGYHTAIYGFYIDKNKELDHGSVKEESRADGGLIAEATGTGNNLKVNIGNSLQGPTYVETTFTAEAETMWWIWDFGLIQDGYENTYNFTNIKLERIDPTFDFANAIRKFPTNASAAYSKLSSGDYGVSFEFTGQDGCEGIGYKISGLTSGSTYTIGFAENYNGSFLDDRYHYGCGVMSSATFDGISAANSKMSDMSWLSGSTQWTTATAGTQIGTITFTADGNTAYWVWNMARIKDGEKQTFKIAVTEFSAKHSGGGTVIYYSESSGFPFPTDDVADGIVLNYDGISQYLEWWPSGEAGMPAAGEDYLISFAPVEGYCMADDVKVYIDDIIYVVSTDGSGNSVATPSYDPETDTLTIPGTLLTGDTRQIAIIANAKVKPMSDMFTIDLPGVSVDGLDDVSLGMDCILTLTPDEGVDFPDLLLIRANATGYVTGLNKELVEAYANYDGSQANSDWLVDNGDGTYKLTIPSGVMVVAGSVKISRAPVKSVALTDLTMGDLS